MDISYRLLAAVALASAILSAILGIFPAAQQARAAEGLPQMAWSRAYDWGFYDYGSSVVQTKDGGFAVTGGTSPAYKGDRNAFLLKTDGSGRELWHKSYGGERFDYGYSVIEAAEGGYTIAGTTQSYGSGSGDVYLVHTEDTGDIVWEKTFGGQGYEEGRSLVQTPDGGYIIAGTTESLGNGSSDIYLIKTDRQGEKEWDRAYGGPNNDLAISIEPTGDGGYIIAGLYGASNSKSTAYLLKIDSGGHWQWDQKLGAYSDSVAYQAKPAGDGGFIAVGYDGVRSGQSKVCLYKVDRYGDAEWQKAMGNYQMQKGYNVFPRPGGGYLILGVAGIADSSGSGTRYVSLLFATDAEGNLQGQQTYDSDRDVFARAGTMTDDGSLAMVGSTGTQGDVETWDVYLARFIWPRR